MHAIGNLLLMIPLLMLAVSMWILGYALLTACTWLAWRHLLRQHIGRVVRNPWIIAAIGAIAFSPSIATDSHYAFVLPYWAAAIVNFEQWDFLKVNSLVALVVFLGIGLWKMRSNSKHSGPSTAAED